MISPPEPGIYHGIPFEQYLEWDAANSHFLQAVDRQSPAHAKWLREHPSDSKDMAFGRMLHSLALETLDFPGTFALMPQGDKRKTDVKAARAAIEKAHPDKQYVEHADYERACAMAKAIRDHRARQCLTNGDPEICLVWDDDETGLRCKGRLDYLRDAPVVIADIKTTRDATRWAFSGSIAKYGYYVQAAFYLDGFHILTGKQAEYIWIAAEKQEPWGVLAHKADAVTIMAGRKSYKRALFVVRQCMETGVWPNYVQELQTISIPRWLIRDEGLEELVV